jgi:molybdopterin-guanine dinucleotide biosynthesis protein B
MISIVGKSGSGKTYLLTKIIRELKERGLRVAIIKHHSHGDFEIDKEGKDTWKFYQSGADAVMISSPVKQALIRRMDGEESLDEIVERFLEDYDIVLTEGFNREGKRRIVIVDSEEDLRYFAHGEILAVVGKNPVGDFLRFDPDDIKGIADFIVKMEKGHCSENCSEKNK